MSDLLESWRRIDRQTSTAGGSGIALCQEWATHIGGGEQVASVIAESLEVGDVYTFAAQPALADDLFQGCRIWGNGLGMTRFGREHWQWLLPVMGRAWRSLNLEAHELVITSSYACVNSVRVPDGVSHVSYCHSPMRYAWEWQSEMRRLPLPLRPLWPATAKRLRKSDRERARQVDLFLTNSRHVGDRIWRYYGARSLVLYPPVDTAYWAPEEAAKPKKDFLLYAGRLVPYKRPDIAVQAATELGRDLVVAGFGSEYERLRKMAGPSVRFVHQPSRAELRQLYREARALVFPGVEDFGMTLVEAQACGTPVIAPNVGGAREAVLNGSTGVLYDDPSVAGLITAIRRFDSSDFHQENLRRHAQSFDTAVFVSTLRAIVAKVRGTSARAVFDDPEFAALAYPAS